MVLDPKLIDTVKFKGISSNPDDYVIELLNSLVYHWHNYSFSDQLQKFTNRNMLDRTQPKHTLKL